MPAPLRNTVFRSAGKSTPHSLLVKSEATATVSWTQGENVCDGRRESRHAQIAIHKQGRNINVVNQVLQVGVETGERVVLIFELCVEAFQFPISGE